MVVAAMKHMALNFVKLDKFEGVDFRRWQKKMHFLLSSISVVYVLTTPIPEDGGDDATVEQIRKRAKWDNDDYVCRGLILNGMSDPLFDIYHNVESFKELWDSLEAKYMAGNASSKKFLHTLKHKKEELTLVCLGSHLRIKESLRVHDSDKPKGNNVVGPSVVNMVEHNNFSRDSKGVNVSNKANGSSTNGLVDGSSNSLKGQNMFNKSLQVYYVSYVSEAYIVQDDDVAWLNIVNDNIASAFMSTSKLNDSILWHARLGHDEALDKFKVCKTEVELLQESQIKRFRTDRGSEVPNKRNRITLYELWTKRKPNLNYLRVWGCRAVVRLPDPKLKTLGERGIECIFVGYAKHSKAFRFYVIEPNDSVAINSIIKSRDAIFDENRYYSVPRSSLMIPNKTEDISGSVVPQEVTKKVVQQPEPKLRKGKRNRTPKGFGPEFQLYLIEGTRDEDVAFWKKAIIDEMDSIMGDNTWVLADLFPGCKPLGCKWIFKRKLKYHKTVDCYDINSQSEYSSDDVKTSFLNGELEEEVDLTKEFLSSRFSMKDMGEAYVILRIRIKHKTNGIAISQSQYIKKVLKKFNYFDCTPVSTPMDTSEKLMPNNGQAVSQLEYSRVIGCLMYVMTCTRPNIAFAVGKLSRYTSNLGTQYWQAIQRVSKYLKKTMDYRLKYTGYPSVLEGYTNASWISNTKDNSSTSGWVFLLGGGAISWASKKQTCITGLIMESGFVALAAAGKEAEWLKNLLLEIPLWSKPITSISIHCDSAATLAKAYN
ncbi:zinc finger, CCHC-type containing protein [Tanacetum coccineum]|uniref:Zinc finger, CCHC-type containing protein n=1 Tax=Tanacetum coccineum TaxID=301880 RepID=A0ABQ4X3T8_9ASTR